MQILLCGLCTIKCAVCHIKCAHCCFGHCGQAHCAPGSQVHSGAGTLKCNNHQSWCLRTEIGTAGGCTLVQGLGRIHSVGIAKLRTLSRNPWLFFRFRTSLKYYHNGHIFRSKSRESCVVRGVTLLQPLVGQTLAFLLWGLTPLACHLY